MGEANPWRCRYPNPNRNVIKIIALKWNSAMMRTDFQLKNHFRSGVEGMGLKAQMPVARNTRRYIEPSNVWFWMGRSRNLTL